MSKPPILSRPTPGKSIYLYLSITKDAISVVIVQEEEKQQKLIYFISRVLHDVETRYQLIEKLALALVTVARRLRSYFQSHQIVVQTDHPIKQVLRKPELARRMVAWSVELSEFGLKYEPRGPMKAHCLADFVA